MPYDLDMLFSWSGNLAMIGWLLLVLSPKRWGFVLVTAGILIPAALGALYGGLMFAYFTSAEGGGYSSLAEVKALFGKDEILLAGWIHYLAFDLAVGTWIAARADEIGISRLIQIPILFFTLMFGPLGFLLFVLTSAGWRAVGGANKGIAGGAAA